VILDELGYLPFPASGGALLFHLVSSLYEKTSLIITRRRLHPAALTIAPTRARASTDVTGS
jgi:hypothetical protein